MESEIKNYLKEHLLAFNTDIQEAFNTKQLKKTPLIFKGKELNEISVYELVCTKRVKITDNVTSAQLEKN